MRTPEQFADWSEAFSACREQGHPILAVVGDEVAKIFPSGRHEPRLPVIDLDKRPEDGLEELA